MFAVGKTLKSTKFVDTSTTYVIFQPFQFFSKIIRHVAKISDSNREYFKVEIVTIIES